MYSLTFIEDKIREKGLLYCISTGIRNYPVIIMKSFVSSIDSKIRLIRKRFWEHKNLKIKSARKNSGTLYAFYDLAVAPATFDIINFLVLTEYHKKQKQCNDLHVVIVPGTDRGFRPNDLKCYQQSSIDQKNANVGYMEWRLRNILIPSCWLMPSCRAITVCNSRQEAQAFETSFVEHGYPSDYSVRYPIQSYDLKKIISLAKKREIIPSIASPEHALKFVREWLNIHTGNRKTIVITFRESTYELDRNSNLSGWREFIQNLDTSIFCPIIIRDTEKAFEPLSSGFEKAITFPEVCFNIELRAALYESCYLNLGVNCGPLMLCVLNNNTRYIMLKLITPTSGATTKNYFQSLGIDPGIQPEMCGPFQKWVWKDDTYNIIIKEFHEMVEKIEASEKFENNQEMKSI